mmetsp:Transcript_81790/g.176803  ORF Transcript_81790/g.176803 Transcript_81790/m.176803 type:complete len:92 (+) Transcript_81790:741-1016(+)|eukprot:CAMPEP_0116938790 /NCGR_PEP_ID=MMETSP0467-20121206/32346_1 /TAXON_ID=283647 /ORGANISM="Mesodinium pulex, Strain SPMC105" /LENGTH=91 /DNA_ID=CAMNT_0004620937 /DNA_START=741 /DNA_END=1016 /DNA_ORIENTATION=+
MMMHLGIPGWHRVFTDLGLDQVTLQWFRYLSPERLAIDFKGTNPETNLKKRRKTRKKKNKNTEVNNSHLFYKDFDEEQLNVTMFEVKDCGI